MYRIPITEKEFIDLIEKHQGILHKIVFLYSHTQADREDLYQEIVLQLWMAYPSFEGKSLFSSWMYRVALNTSITQTRKPGFSFERKEFPVPVFDPEFAMDLSEEIKLLYRGISMLGKVDRAIILLWLEERSYAEIAGVMGISEKNVSVRLVRIKEKLIRIMERFQ